MTHESADAMRLQAYKDKCVKQDARIKELTEMLRKVNKYYGIPPHSDKAYEIQHEIQALLNKGE